MAQNTKVTFHTEKAAYTGGPYSQAVIHNGLIYISGQIALDPETNEARLGTIEEQTNLALQNLKIILEQAGSSLDNVLKVNVFLASIDDYPKFNEVYGKFFPIDRPARTCVAVIGLPLGAKVEIDAIAMI